MSLSMTFRQKLIRITCSASICGLSFSFIIGEAVDHQAKQIRAWTIDPNFFPESFGPTQPVMAMAQAFDSMRWREQLITANSLEIKGAPILEGGAASYLADKFIPALPKTLPSVSPDRLEQKAKETISVASAAPDKSELKHSEVEVILASIHTATNRLSQRGPSFPSADTVAVTKTSKPKSSAPLEKQAGPMIPRQVIAAVKAQAPKQEHGGEFWVIAGNILSSTAQKTEQGHFEVGLYSKIDPEQNPVGFPMPQQILPAGENSFRLEVPQKIENGYLIAEFVSANTGKRTRILPSHNPFTRGHHPKAELVFLPKAEDVVTTVASALAAKVSAETEKLKISGKITTMFAGSSQLPQADVVVKLRGRKEATRTDRSGSFVLELPKLKGSLYLEVLKPGYHPLIVSVPSGIQEPINIEIASRHAMEQLSQRLGANQSGTSGILVGRAIGANGEGLRGMAAQLSVKADGPFYFDDEGVATRDLRSTSGNGRFIFFNIEPGSGFLETSINGEAVAPIEISTVEGGEMIQKTLTPVPGTIRGRVFNPVASVGKMLPVSGAKVRIEGASDWVNTDSFGAFSIGPVKWIKGERISLELSAEKFNNHRYNFDPNNGAGLNLFAFPAPYLTKLARSMDLDIDPYSGLIVGKVTGPSVRMDALADHSVVNSARDFYFDSRGRLRGSHEMTDPRYGTYVIFNVPKGRTLLHGNDSGGILRYSESVISSPASVSILMD